MNVTEKQKEILISFMQKYPDFGRCLKCKCIIINMLSVYRMSLEYSLKFICIVMINMLLFVPTLHSIIYVTYYYRLPDSTIFALILSLMKLPLKLNLNLTLIGFYQTLHCKRLVKLIIYML